MSTSPKKEQPIWIAWPVPHRGKPRYKPEPKPKEEEEDAVEQTN